MNLINFYKIIAKNSNSRSLTHNKSLIRLNNNNRITIDITLFKMKKPLPNSTTDRETKILLAQFLLKFKKICNEWALLE